MRHLPGREPPGDQPGGTSGSSVPAARRGRGAADLDLPAAPLSGVALPSSRRRLLLTVWAVVTAGALVRAFAAGVLGSGTGTPPAEAHRLDLNRASVAELMALPGVGRVRAEAIVLHRVRHGPFRALAELAAVDGIGPKS